MADSRSIGVSTSEPISFFSWLSRNRDADVQSGQGTRAAVGGGEGMDREAGVGVPALPRVKQPVGTRCVVQGAQLSAL